MTQYAVIAGAGPAGLTAAVELLANTSIVPLLFEGDATVGGISRTVEYRGNRMDLGGHRFFSKSEWVMGWWQAMLPIASENVSHAVHVKLSYQGQTSTLLRDRITTQPADAARVMLVRSRLSRILYRRRFFDYPLKLNLKTLRGLGFSHTAAVAASYLAACLHPIKPEATLEDFLINRFGRKLYLTFFKDYTEKVWGTSCNQISAEWGAQRIKGLSVATALHHALRAPFRRGGPGRAQTETSLIEHFLYPRLGPGQMWEVAAERVVRGGGQLFLQHRVVGLRRNGSKVTAVEVEDVRSGLRRWQSCDFFLSSMPINLLVELLGPEDSTVVDVAQRLPHRDFMTAGLLVKRMRSGGGNKGGTPPDNWIYIQDPDVCLGRLQIFNNWSPALVADPNTVWLGLEYFCNAGDELWNMSDSGFLSFAAEELERLGLIDRADVLDGTVIRVPKAYPAYFGSYPRMAKVREYLDGFSNLYPIGRNGMHRYNNQDHSMLSAKVAVDLISGKSADRQALWAVNSEDEYHETR